MIQLIDILNQIISWLNYIVPNVGVGGGVEAKEYVEIIPLIKYTLLFLAGIGIVFGLGLAFAAKKFSVEIDPRVQAVLDVLAHAH